MACTDGTHRGLQIANFTWPGVAAGQHFDRVAAVIVTAEESGFDTVFVMDHFFQLPLIGPLEVEMFEAYTLLDALAARTTTARLGTLVTGVTYRNPTLLAKAVTALDIAFGAARCSESARPATTPSTRRSTCGSRRWPSATSGPRTRCGSAARCSPREEHRRRPPPLRYRCASNSPAPITPGAAPILVGGSGERKTFGLAAKYADELNVNASFVDLPRKVAALVGHLDALGRDRSEITVTCLGTIVTAPTHEAAAAKVARPLRSRGLDDPDAVLADAELTAGLLPRFLWGDADDVAAQVATLRAAGVDGVVVNMILDGHDVDSVALAGTLTKALA